MFIRIPLLDWNFQQIEKKILQCPDGLLRNAEQGGGAGEDKDEDSEEDVNGQVGGAKVGRQTREQEGDEARQPLKVVEKILYYETSFFK